MKRFAFLLIVLIVFNSTKAFCDYRLQVSGGGVKKLVFTEGKILSTDGKFLVMTNEAGERITSAQLALDNSYLLQEALYNDNSYYLLYQHTGVTADFTIVKLNENLEPMWQKGFSHQGSTFGYAMAAGHNGGVVVTGRSCNSGFFLFAVDATGSEVWKQLYMEGNPTTLPGAIQINDNGFLVAIGFEAAGSNNLAMMQCNTIGQVLHTTITQIETGFYIKGMTSTANGTDVLLHRPAAETNTVVTFNNGLVAEKKSDLSASSALQLNGIARIDNDLFVCGNLLQSNTGNLDFVYARLNTSTNALESFITGTENSYDNAQFIGSSNGNIWIGGIVSGNGQVLSLSQNGTPLCSFQSVDLTIQTTNVNSVPAGMPVAMLTDFSVSSSYVNVVNTQTDIAITCTSEITTAVNQKVNVVSDVSINIYPNPASDRFSLNVENDNLNHMTLYSIAGQAMIHQAVSKGINVITASHLPAGVYSVVVSNAHQSNSVTRRLVLLP